MQLLNTLYVTTPDAYLHLDHDTLRIEVERETRLRVPLHHLSAVVCFGHVMLSPILMHRLADEGKSLVLLDGHGRFKARLEGATAGNVLLRQAQHRRSAEADFFLAAAKSSIAGKLKNCRQVLLRGARETGREPDSTELAATAEEFVRALARLEHAPDLDAVRGIEGDAAKRYFAAFGLLVRSEARADFTPNGRTRRPPLDRMNALLSFFYSMLMNDCRSAIESVGLDPQIGFLHAVRPGRAALALDLMEEFRPLVVDSAVLMAVNNGEVKPHHFAQALGSVVMTPEGRRAFLDAFERRLAQEVTHPVFGYRVSYRRVFEVQARLLGRLVTGEIAEYPSFTTR